MRTILAIALLSLTLISCRQTRPGGATSSGGGGPVSDFGTSSPRGSSTTPSAVDGTSSGGGGFADTYARETLLIAKDSLARLIRGANPALFQKLPKDRDQEWLAKLIQHIELKKDEAPSRYGNPLKFDYDLKLEKIYATKHYVSTFPYGRFWTRSTKEQHRIFIEVMLDLLHEASHFYGIGTTEESDPNSEAWAMIFMETLSKDVLACVSEKLSSGAADTSLASAIYLHRPSGLYMSQSIESHATGQRTESYEDYYNKLGSNDFRFLTSPQLFLGEIEFQPKATSSEADKAQEKRAIAKLIELSGTKLATIMDDQMQDDDYGILFQGPDRFHGTYEKLHTPMPRNQKATLGLPRSSGNEIVYARERKDLKEIRDVLNSDQIIVEGNALLFDQFRVNTEKMKATYYYGLKAETATVTPEMMKSDRMPLYTKRFEFTCQPLPVQPILVERFQNARVLTQDEVLQKASEAELPVSGTLETDAENIVPIGSPPFTDFVLKMNAFMTANAKIDPKNPTVKDLTLKMRNCELNLSAYTSDGNEGFIVDITETPIHLPDETLDLKKIIAFQQFNFVTKGREKYAPESGLEYALSAYSVPEGFHIRMAGTTDNVKYVSWEFHGGGRSGAKSDLEVQIDVDPQSGKITQVKAIDHLKAYRNLTCVAE